MKSSFFVLALLLCLSSNALAIPITYVATLSGPAESPPNASPGIGTALVTIDTTAHTLFVTATFSGLLGPTTASHIHCCTPTALTGTAGVATQTPSFDLFPLGVLAGTFTRTYDTSDPATWNAPFVAANGGTALGAEAVMAAGLASGKAYYNIHSTFAGGGEIRGFLVPAPEPASLVLLGAGLAGLVGFARKGRRT